MNKFYDFKLEWNNNISSRDIFIVCYMAPRSCSLVPNHKCIYSLSIFYFEEVLMFTKNFIMLTNTLLNNNYLLLYNIFHLIFVFLFTFYSYWNPCPKKNIFYVSNILLFKIKNIDSMETFKNFIEQQIGLIHAMNNEHTFVFKTGASVKVLKTSKVQNMIKSIQNCGFNITYMHFNRLLISAKRNKLSSDISWEGLPIK